MLRQTKWTTQEASQMRLALRLRPCAVKWMSCSTLCTPKQRATDQRRRRLRFPTASLAVLRTLAICQVTTFHLLVIQAVPPMVVRQMEVLVVVAEVEMLVVVAEVEMLPLSLLAAMTAMEATMAAMEMGKEMAKGKG